MNEKSKSSSRLDAVILDEIVPARQPWGRVIEKGEILRIVDLEGQQAVDFLCYDAADPKDRYSAMNTVKLQGNVYVKKGTVLYSEFGKPLFTVIEDTCGYHDSIAGCCSEASNFIRYGVRGEPNCYDNFLAILAKFGLGQSSIVSNINFFMYVPVEADGTMGIKDGISKPGSHVDLRAERDVIAVLSNCPQIHNPCNGYNPTPIRVIVRRGEGAG